MMKVTRRMEKVSPPVAGDQKRKVKPRQHPNPGMRLGERKRRKRKLPTTRLPNFENLHFFCIRVNPSRNQNPRQLQRRKRKKWTRMKPIELGA